MLLLTVGCGAGTQAGSPRHTGVSAAATVSLAEGIEMLSDADAEVIRNLAGAQAPQDPPPYAVSVGFFGTGEYDDPPRRPSELVVANFWPTLLRVNVVCLVDATQVPCTKDAVVWRVEFDEPGLAVVALPESDARRDVILVEERDHMAQRTYPVSRVRPIDGWDVPISDLSDPPAEIDNPLGGCDWALLMDDLDPSETFEPMRTRPAGTTHLVISTCPDNASHEMWPLIVLDDTTVATIDTFQPFLAEPDTTYALRIPDELLDTAQTIRGAVVRRAPDRGHWTTHPLTTATDTQTND